MSDDGILYRGRYGVPPSAALSWKEQKCPKNRSPMTWRHWDTACSWRELPVLLVSTATRAPRSQWPRPQPRAKQTGLSPWAVRALTVARVTTNRIIKCRCISAAIICTDCSRPERMCYDKMALNCVWKEGITPSITFVRLNCECTAKFTNCTIRRSFI